MIQAGTGHSPGLASPDSSLVSVIIPVFNQSEFIAQALASVLEQSYAAIEIIVVDDGSSDCLGDSLAPFRERIRYLRQENAGPSSARNLGLEHARGEFVVFLDADDWMLPKKVADHLACFEAEPKLDLVNSGVRVIDDISGESVTLEPWRKSPLLDLQAFLLSHAFYLPAFMFRRAVLERAGGFDCQLRQAEDVDLLLRVMLAGNKGGWLMQSTINHRLHPHSLTRYTGERVASVTKVFASFFSRTNLPVYIAAMKHEVCYQVWMWGVWQHYRHGDKSLIPGLLRQTLPYMDSSRSEALHRWIEQIRNYGRTEAPGDEARILADFLPWYRAAFASEQPESRAAHKF